MKKQKYKRSRKKSSKSEESFPLSFILGIVFLVFVVYKILPSYLFITRPTPNSISLTDPDTSISPVQINLTPEEFDENIIDDILIDGKIIKIKPVAKYEISARVVSKRNYTEKWDGKLMPVDLALVWGDLAKEEHHQFMTYRHSDRYFSWNSTGKAKLNKKYIISHSANVHFISANKNIENALLTTDIDENVKIIGYLVDITGPGGDSKRTSLSREDNGSGACENVYIQKLKIGKEVFQ
ncbi:MAG: hypothetical protein HN576_08220 [Bacteriovoracaceae bacterium]|jgi:hypothetical protein|nr:hypothetical protein [Bacteriovoracaceae bacterium]